jgi:hypothetical protein
MNQELVDQTLGIIFAIIFIPLITLGMLLFILNLIKELYRSLKQ